MAYVEKYNLTFGDFFGNEIELRLLEDGYSGSVTTLIGKGNPISVKMNSEDNGVFSFIRGVAATINIQCTSSEQYEDLLTYSNTRFKVEIYKDSTLYFDGWLEQGLSTRDIQVYNVLSLTAICGIGYLKNIQYKNITGISDYFTEYQTLYEVIYWSLYNIETDITIYDGADIFGTSATSESPWVNEYINPELFRLDDDNTWNCYDVLNEVLRTKLCKMFRWGDGWYIIPCDYDQDTITLKILSGLDGTQSGTVVHTLNSDITNATASPLNVPINHSAFREYVESYKEIKVTQEYGLVKTLYRPTSTDDFVQYSTAANRGTLEFEFQTNKFKFKRGTGDPVKNDPILSYHLGYFYDDLFDSFDISLKILSGGLDTIYVRIYGYDGVDSLNNKELQPDGSWGGVTDLFTITETGTYTVTSEPLELTGDYYMLFMFEDSTGAHNPDHPRYMETDIDECKIQIIRNEELLKVKEEESITSIGGDGNSLNVADEFKFKIGGNIYAALDHEDNMPNIYNGVLYEDVSGDFVIIKTFTTTKVGFGSMGLSSQYMIANRIIEKYNRPFNKLTCVLHGDVMTPLTQPVYISKMFNMIRFEYNMKQNIWDIESYEVYNYTENYLELESGLGDLLLEEGTTDKLILE